MASSTVPTCSFSSMSSEDTNGVDSEKIISVIWPERWPSVDSFQSRRSSLDSSSQHLSGLSTLDTSSRHSRRGSLRHSRRRSLRRNSFICKPGSDDDELAASSPGEKETRSVWRKRECWKAQRSPVVPPQKPRSSSSRQHHCSGLSTLDASSRHSRRGSLRHSRHRSLRRDSFICKPGSNDDESAASSPGEKETRSAWRERECWKAQRSPVLPPQKPRRASMSDWEILKKKALTQSSNPTNRHSKPRKNKIQPNLPCMKSEPALQSDTEKGLSALAIRESWKKDRRPSAKLVLESKVSCSRPSTRRELERRREESRARRSSIKGAMAMESPGITRTRAVLSFNRTKQ